MQRTSNRMAITVVISCLTLVFVLVLGRQSTLLALKTFLVPHRTSTAHGDSTVAILYPRNKLNEIMDLMNNEFICETNDTSLNVEKVAIDIQLANVIERKYKGTNAMIWVIGDFFYHIGYYTSLQFKNLHKEIGYFVSGYIKLPDQFCDNPK